LAAEEKHSREVVGDGFLIVHQDKSVEIGWGLHPALWRLGFGTEIGGALLALAVEKLKAKSVWCKIMKPNVASELKPWAWWSFDDQDAKDRTGRFPITQITGGAKVEDGKLVLDGISGEMLCKTGKEPPFAYETPARPENPPANWLTFHLAHPGPGTAMPGEPAPHKGAEIARGTGQQDFRHQPIPSIGWEAADHPAARDGLKAMLTLVVGDQDKINPVANFSCARDYIAARMPVGRPIHYLADAGSSGLVMIDRSGRGGGCG